MYRKQKQQAIAHKRVDVELLHAIFLEPKRIRGDFVRSQVVEIAALCSMGYVTTHEGGNIYGQYYRLTTKGMAAMIGAEDSPMRDLIGDAEHDILE